MLYHPVVSVWDHVLNLIFHKIYGIIDINSWYREISILSQLVSFLLSGIIVISDTINACILYTFFEKLKIFSCHILYRLSDHCDFCNYLSTINTAFVRNRPKRIALTSVVTASLQRDFSFISIINFFVAHYIFSKEFCRDMFLAIHLSEGWLKSTSYIYMYLSFLFSKDYIFRFSRSWFYS